MKRLIAIAASIAASLLLCVRAGAQMNYTYAYSTRGAIDLSKDMQDVLVRSYDRVYINGHKASMKEIRSYMDPKTFSGYRAGRVMYRTLFPVSCLGGAAIFGGFSGLVVWYVSGDNNEALAKNSLYTLGAGFAAVFLTLPFEMAGLKIMDNAVDSHNRKNGVAFSPASEGIGIRMTF